MIERPYAQSAVIDGIVLVTRNQSDYAVNPTIQPGDVKISLDGGAFVNPANLPVATPSGSTSIRAIFTAGELTCQRMVVRFISQQFPKLWEDQELIVETFGNPLAQRDIAGEVLDSINGVEAGLTLRQALRACSAILFGVVTGYPNGPGVFKAPDGITSRVTVTHDADGNRLVITLNL